VLDLVINITVLALFIKPLLALAKRHYQNLQENQKLAEFTHTSTTEYSVDTSHGTQTADMNNASALRLTTRPSVDVAPLSNPEDIRKRTTTSSQSAAQAKKQLLKEFRKTSQFYKLSVKTTVLISIMVIVTTAALLLYSQLVWTIGLVIDIVVNCFCLLLTFKTYNKIYRFFFTSCDICCATWGSCIISMSQHKGNEKQMAFEIQQSNDIREGDETPVDENPL